MAHRSLKLELRVDKPENVYRYIYDWQESECSHGPNARYLFLHALVQWGPNREWPENVFSVAMQYSTSIGQNVDISQPAHLTEEDAVRVLREFSEFVARRAGQR